MNNMIVICNDDEFQFYTKHNTCVYYSQSCRELTKNLISINFAVETG